MRIMNNVSSLNAWRNLTATDGGLGKSLERLSSGYRINRSADDAAGLAMSEKMRAQIKGMNQSVKNAQDGISMVQTAEGALNEVHTILQRMRELAVQAGNGTLTGADRNQIQTEMDELASEITRITNTTQYNSKDLVNGAMQTTGTGQITFQIGPNQNQTMNFSIAPMDAKSLGVSRDLRETQDNNDLLNTIDLVQLGAVGPIAGANQLVDGDYLLTVEQTGAATYEASLSDLDGVTNVGTAAVVTAGGTFAINYNVAADQLAVNFNNVFPSDAVGTTWTAKIKVDAAAATTFSSGSKTADAVTIAGLDVTTEANATSAITKINTAINTVSAQRSNLGAGQNRLEHTINNLQVVSENLVASESRIRDVDMAQEMSQFTKNQILMQAGTAMLAQANAKNQAVLQLLQ